MTKLSNENWENKIICINNEFSYDYYKELVNKYMKNDCREINFQNRVVVPFLERLFINTEGISIVDVSMQYKNRNSEIHDTFNYSSQEKAAAPPDLLIADNWNYANKNNKEINYLAAIEIKSPVLDPIYDKKIEEYKKHTRNEVSFHLEANRKVILTDCIRWQFFESGCELDPIQTIDLFDENKKWKTKIVKNDEFLIEQLQLDSTREDDPDKWKLLCGYIPKFLTEN
ncbi:hypothetical protein RCG17_22985 [Neobacillus sp. PS3-12]|uniref:hypothetical protein n=1 Tax=Neobacillus sp. PS3-12 TaxID=3070677 RepID=UPI0027DFE255|nr:hypothetical protein [Neobacillus sp. PS3-12]WML52224.1 hypothetical protein RCG17_22985 [Neobacillus sp. PS3-12]